MIRSTRQLKVNLVFLLVGNLLGFDSIAQGRSYSLIPNELEVTSFNNGDPILEAKTAKEWEEFCLKEQPTFRRIKTGSTERMYYNLYVVIDERGVCPPNTRLPSTSDVRSGKLTAPKNLMTSGFIVETGAILNDGTICQYYWMQPKVVNREYAPVMNVCQDGEITSTSGNNMEGFPIIVYVEKATIESRNEDQYLQDTLGLSRYQIQKMLNQGFYQTNDGDKYDVVRVGKDIWMADNLEVSHFRNGDEIFHAETKEEWEKAAARGEAAWCYYDFKFRNGRSFGKLYNWYAVSDSRGLAPHGWRIATPEDWRAIRNDAGINAAQELKSKGSWLSDVGKRLDPFGFSALPAGGITESGESSGNGQLAYFWAHSEGREGKGVVLISSDSKRIAWGVGYPGHGFSVRCVLR